MDGRGKERYLHAQFDLIELVEKLQTDSCCKHEKGRFEKTGFMLSSDLTDSDPHSHPLLALSVIYTYNS